MNMALFKGELYAKSLGMNVGLNIILTQDMYEKEPKVLYLLHGMSDGCGAWTRWTRIEHYAKEYGYIVIMPEVHISFYMNMEYGGNYYTYITEELPMLCEKMFGIKPDREKTYIAGLSMGGYGSMLCAFRNPQQYKACGALSAPCDIKARMEERGRDEKWIKAIIGDKPVDESCDLYKLTARLMDLAPAKRPGLMLVCRTGDFLYEDNEAFKKYLETIYFDFNYEVWEGDHNWDFWEVGIQKVLRFFEGDSVKI